MGKINQKNKNESPKDPPRLCHVYVSKEDQEFWKILDKAKQHDMNSSSLICKIVIDSLKNSTICNVISKSKEDQDAFELLKGVARSYRFNKIQGIPISKYLEYEHIRESLSTDELVDLFLLITETYVTLMSTDVRSKFLTSENSKGILDSIEAFASPKRVKAFKDRLYNEIFIDHKRIENEKKQQELRIQREQQRKLDEEEKRKREDWCKQTGRPKEEYGLDQEDDFNLYVAQVLRDGGEIINGRVVPADELNSYY